MNDIEAMLIALEEAKKAKEEGEVPVGAVVVFEGRVIARAHNRRENDLDISGHAEILALKEAARVLKRWTLEGCRLVVTLEPCPMCAGAILQSRISSLCFGAKDAKEGAIVSSYYLFDKKKGAPLVSFGTLEEQCSSLLKDFFRARRD